MTKKKQPSARKPLNKIGEYLFGEFEKTEAAYAKGTVSSVTLADGEEMDVIDCAGTGARLHGRLEKPWRISASSGDARTMLGAQ